MDITRRLSPNRNIGRQNWKPDIIVCHITEGAFDGTVSWINNPASQVSYHFVVAKDGRIVQAVDIANTAWANGTTVNGDNRDNRHSTLPTVVRRGVNANLYTVSIGFEGRFADTQGALTAAQLEVGIWLIKHIRDEILRLFNISNVSIQFNRNHIVGHHEITPKTRPNCPGSQFPFDALIKHLNQKPQQTIEPEKPSLPPESTIQLPAGHVPSDWALQAWEWAFSNGITDGTNPQGTPSRQQMMQLLFNYHRFAQQFYSATAKPMVE